MIQVIHDLITKYSSPETICCRDDGFVCDAILLGSLVKSAAAIGISPRPKRPYPGITFKGLAKQIQEMQILDCCRSRGGFSSSYNHGIKDHGVRELIEATMRSLGDGMCGLELQSSLPEKARALSI